MKVAIVTGGAKGLGAEIVKSLTERSFTVVISYRKSRQEAEKLLSEIQSISPRSMVINGDMTRESDVANLAARVLKKYGKIDLLVNNVGNFIYKPFGQTSNEEFRDMVESNIYSTLYVSRAVLPAMRKQKSGNIINIGAVGCERVQLTQNSTPYFMGKHGVYIVTKAMARDEAKYRIRVNMISPGSMATDIFKQKEFPGGRCTNYKDVIKAILFLISEDNSYINGANIEVAGGFIPGAI